MSYELAERDEAPRRGRASLRPSGEGKSGRPSSSPLASAPPPGPAQWWLPPTTPPHVTSRRHPRIQLDLGIILGLLPTSYDLSRPSCRRARFPPPVRHHFDSHRHAEQFPVLDTTPATSQYHPSLPSTAPARDRAARRHRRPVTPFLRAPVRQPVDLLRQVVGRPARVS